MSQQDVPDIDLAVEGTVVAIEGSGEAVVVTCRVVARVYRGTGAAQ